jgi:hypothetical protein
MVGEMNKGVVLSEWQEKVTSDEKKTGGGLL